MNLNIKRLSLLALLIASASFAFTKTYFIYTFNGKTYWTVTPANIDCDKFKPAAGVDILDCWNEKRTSTTPIINNTGFSLNMNAFYVSFKNKNTELDKELISFADIDNLSNGIYPLISISGGTITYSYTNENHLLNPNTNQTQINNYSVPTLLFETNYSVGLVSNPISNNYTVSITPNSTELPPINNISISFVNQNNADTYIYNVTNNTLNVRDANIANGIYHYVISFNQGFTVSGIVYFE